MTATRIYTYDSTLRDGEQCEGITLSLADKLAIVRRLDEFGIDYIEGGFPASNPKDVAFFREVAAMDLKHAQIAAFGSTCKKGVAAADDPGLAEKVVTEFDLPGGGKMEYPVSQGIVSLQTASDTPFDSYLDVQNRIAQAFDDIRTHLAQRQFGKPYGELSDAQRQVVMRAVPLKISEAEPHVSR